MKGERDCGVCVCVCVCVCQKRNKLRQDRIKSLPFSENRSAFEFSISNNFDFNLSASDIMTAMFEFKSLDVCLSLSTCAYLCVCV